MKAKVVCKLCNNRWMSDVETKAKWSLIPLIERANYPVRLTVEDQCAIALWLGLRSIVFDSSGIVPPEERYFTQAERESFAAGDVFLPENTHIWMSPYTTGPPRAYFEVTNGKLSANATNPSDRMHLMTCAIDQIVFQVWTGTAGFKVDFAKMHAVWGQMVVQLWPNEAGEDIHWPPAFQVGERNLLAFRDRLKPKLKNTEPVTT
jgi:hypothetical protein